MRTFIGLLIAGAAVFIALCLLAGCGTYAPCWYGPANHRKALTQREANKMKAQGMTVTCPGDEKNIDYEAACSDYDDCVAKMIDGHDYGKKPLWQEQKP